MEELCGKLAHTMGEKLGYDDERRRVVAYGLTALCQMLLMFAISSAVGLLCGCWYESFTVFLAVGTMRKFTGGVHSKTMRGCLIIGIVTIGIMAAAARYAVMLIPGFESLFIRGVFALAISALYAGLFIVVYRLAPVETPNKPIRKPEKIARLRRGSLTTVMIYSAASLMFSLLSYLHLRFASVSLALLFGAAWQTFTLTRPAHKIIGAIDARLSGDR